MLSSIFIALLQAVAGDPAPVTETPAAESVAAAPATAPRTERRRVCSEPVAATGGRLTQRRCRWEEVPIEETPAPEATAAAPQHEHSGGGSSSAAVPATPQ